MALPRPVGRQAQVVYLLAEGHHVVLGTAGTGKTVMAIHRAVHLADTATRNSGPTLLVTYNRSLVSYLRHLAGDHRMQLQIETYGKFAVGYLGSRGKMGSQDIIKPGPRERLILQAVQNVAATYESHDFFRRTSGFFIDELEWIDGNGIRSLEGYLSALRVGRMEALHPSFRQIVWQIREQYLQLRAQAGFAYSWSTLPMHIQHEVQSDSTARLYKHIVVDEGQDLSPEAIRSLVAILPSDGSITFFADYAQQLYGQRISWRSVGLAVQHVEYFEENYRNTREIAELAQAMATMDHFLDTSDLVVPKAPAAAGSKPALVRFDDEGAETARVRQLAASNGQSFRVAVLCQTHAMAAHATAGVRNRKFLSEDGEDQWADSPGVYCGTLHSARGLEFDLVILPYCTATRFPRPQLIDDFGWSEAASRDSRLLYVGVTRAQQDLLVTYSGDLCALLPAPGSPLWL